MTMISSSSNSTLSGMLSGAGAASSAGGTSRRMVAPAVTRGPGSRIVAPSIATRPARISALWRERGSSGGRAARTRASRAPASSAATITLSLRPCVEAMSNPSADDDDKPLDPAAARMVARARWLMVISGATTLVAVAAVLGVIGYRLFRVEGSTPAQADVTALLPKGARILSTAVAEGRIAVTVHAGGTIEIRTFALKTLQPTGRV